MKLLLKIVGIVLIIFGFAVLGYKGISYTKQDKVAEIGSMQVTVSNQEHIYFSPLVGVAAILAGGILVFLGRRS